MKIALWLSRPNFEVRKLKIVYKTNKCLGHLLFNRHSQTIDILTTYPQTFCKTVAGFVHSILVKNNQASLNTIHTPSELEEPNLDNNWWSIYIALRPIREFS